MLAAESTAQKKMNILCVCAHPDDAEFGCGGTLLKYHKQGHKIFFGLHIGAQYAEGFKTFRISGYMPDYKVLP